MVVVVNRLLLALVATAAALLSAAGGAWAIPAPTTLGYTGGEQAYGVPSGVLVVGVAVQGAWGGESNNVGQQGEGITGYLTVRPGRTVFAEVGQNGGYDGGATFGGGGAAGAPPPTLSGANGEFASAGGGRRAERPYLLAPRGELFRRRQLARFAADRRRRWGRRQRGRQQQLADVRGRNRS